MKQKRKWFSLALLAAFVVWTLLVRWIDVKPIGPEGSAVGFATLNAFVHDLTGVHMSLYTLTDWLGLLPVAIALGFALLGLAQWIRRRRLGKVDRSILMLGGFYAMVVAVFLFFEMVVINYRPVLILGALEASYPSSTTLLTLCVMPTAAMQARARVKKTGLRRGLTVAIVAFTAFMVIARLLSGVHWITDILGGALLSAGLVTWYRSLTNL